MNWVIFGTTQNSTICAHSLFSSELQALAEMQKENCWDHTSIFIFWTQIALTKREKIKTGNEKLRDCYRCEIIQHSYHGPTFKKKNIYIYFFFPEKETHITLLNLLVFYYFIKPSSVNNKICMLCQELTIVMR